MRWIIGRLAILTGLGVASVNAGALYVEVGNTAASPEARSLHAAFVARVTACHEPAKSVVTADTVRLTGGKTERIPLQVVPLKTAGEFAVIGVVDRDSVIDVAVTNPQFPNYKPHVLLRGGESEVQLAGAKRFFGTAPTDEDVRSLARQ